MELNTQKIKTLILKSETEKACTTLIALLKSHENNQLMFFEDTVHLLLSDLNSAKKEFGIGTLEREKLNVKRNITNSQLLELLKEIIETFENKNIEALTYSTREEHRAWLQCLVSNSKIDYEGFVKKYTKSFRTKEAYVKIDELFHAEQENQEEHELWKKHDVFFIDNTIGSIDKAIQYIELYNSYLKKSKLLFFKEKALEKIDTLEDCCWYFIRSDEPNIDNFKKYYQYFPSGKYKTESEKPFWFLIMNSTDLYPYYFKIFPDGQFKDIATEELKAKEIKEQIEKKEYNKRLELVEILRKKRIVENVCKEWDNMKGRDYQMWELNKFIKEYENNQDITIKSIVEIAINERTKKDRADKIKNLEKIIDDNPKDNKYYDVEYHFKKVDSLIDSFEKGKLPEIAESNRIDMIFKAKELRKQLKYKIKIKKIRTSIEEVVLGCFGVIAVLFVLFLFALFNGC